MEVTLCTYAAQICWCQGSLAWIQLYPAKALYPAKDRGYWEGDDTFSPRMLVRL